MENICSKIGRKNLLLEQDNKGICNRDYSSMDHLHPLIWANSLEAKCDECYIVSRNQARLAKHKENKQT